MGLTIVLLVALAAGCASVNRLRDAQDAFNQAAAAENALRFDTKAADAATSLLSVRGGYTKALVSLEKLENTKEQRQLSRDGLWGTALTLKALTQWRLGQFEGAITNAELARTAAGDQIYPRDLAILIALPGLVKTDQAYYKIIHTTRTNELAEVEAMLVGPSGAVADIENAHTQVDKDHPVQVYLLQAQLAAYRNYQVALERLKNQAVGPFGDPARAKAKAQLAELRRVLEAQGAGKAGEELVKSWSLLCGINVP